VHNKSDKDLGAHSISRRRIEFRITQTRESALIFGASNADSLEIPISLLASRESTDVELVVKVPRKAKPYEKTDAHITLWFTPPDNSEPCEIQVYHFPIQVSNTFHHDGEADILLVTNFETSAEEVDTWYNLICNRLGMKMDVWNVSVNGHLELLGGPRDIERQGLFELYKGKTVIMLGNNFPYFDRGQRTAMNLIDPKAFVPASHGGTSLFISGLDVDQKQSLHLTRFLCSSAYSNSHEYTSIKQLVAGILLECRQKEFYNTVFVCLPTKRGDNAQRCSSKANRASSELLRRLPNFRFVISWRSAEALDGNVNGAGKVEVRPCTPYDRSKFIVTRPVPAGRSEEMNEFTILLSLPFTRKLEFLWLEFSQDGSARKKTALQWLSDVIRVELINELSRLVHSTPPWPDSIQKEEVHSHLPRLDEFFGHDSARQFSPDSLNCVVELLGDIRLLANCCPGSVPRKLTISTRRKNLWTEIGSKIDTFFDVHYGHLGKKNVAKEPFTKYVTNANTRAANENHESRKASIIRRVVAKLPLNVGEDFSDNKVGVVDFELMGNIVVSQSEAANWKQRDFSSATQLDEDLAHAKEQVKHDLSRLPAYIA